VVLAASKSNGSIGLIFPLLLVAMVGFLFLSTRKRKAAAAQTQTNLRVGSSIMTTAGLYATVVAVVDDGVILEVAPGVRSKYARAAISRVLDAPEGAEPLDDESDPPPIDLDKDPPSNP
jgi:preprotein translocase subunit YajC